MLPLSQYNLTQIKLLPMDNHSIDPLPIQCHCTANLQTLSQWINTQPIHGQFSATVLPLSQWTMTQVYLLSAYQWITTEPIHCQSSATLLPDFSQILGGGQIWSQPLLCHLETELSLDCHLNNLFARLEEKMLANTVSVHVLSLKPIKCHCATEIPLRPIQCHWDQK